MTVTIRTFKNTDVRAVCDLWNAHYADQGPESSISELRLELSCLAKPFFEGDDFFIAEVEGRPAGFIHLAASPNSEMNDKQTGSVCLAALCVEQTEFADTIAAKLLEHADTACRRMGVSGYSFRPMLPSGGFYLGNGVAGSMIGVTAKEKRLVGWLDSAGFSPSVPTNCWEIDLATFRPPVDRQQIQIRRTTQVNQEIDEPQLPWWQACILGHTDPVLFQLTHRLEKRVVHEVLFWTVAPELQALPYPTGWLWPLSNTGAAASEDAAYLLFLLAESLRQLQNDRVDVVRTASAASDTAVNGLLRRLGFKSAANGIVFEKEVKPSVT